MRDFTLTTYEKLLAGLKNAGFKFCTLGDICRGEQEGRFVVLRHDVDRRPQNALRMAILENEAGISSTYYFRVKKEVFIPEIIKKISDLGHEIGYHFEDLTSRHGDVDEAVSSFRNNIEMFRKIVPVHTVSMHGRPLSKFDNRELLKSIDLAELGILCEPYSIVEKLKMAYLTDVGRKWNNSALNLRDKVRGQKELNLRTTFDIIEVLESGMADKKLMINIHPERWDEELLPWIVNAVWQKMKNGLKYVLIRMRHGS